VTTELTAVLVDDRALRRLEPAPAEERAVVVAGEEARLLALGPLGGGEAGALRLGACLCLRGVSERKADVFEERGRERREHVGLVLCRIDATREQAAAAVLDDAGVVAGR
jgi:hypothetical protein